MKIFIAAMLTMAAFALTSPAHAGGGTVRLEPPTRHVAHVRVVKVVPVGQAVKVRFNTRSVWRVAPCRFEDSNNCYWNARKRGNGRGTSFVTLRGVTYPIR